MALTTGGMTKKSLQLEIDIQLKGKQLKELQNQIRKTKGEMNAFRRDMGALNNERKRFLRTGKQNTEEGKQELDLLEGRIDRNQEMLTTGQRNLGQLETTRESMRDHISLQKQNLANTKKEIKETSRFKFEWLGLMFAGMALSNVFAGNIKQVAEMVGITGLLSTTIMLLLLPALLPLLDIFIDLLNWVLDLTDGQRKFIGQLMILTFIVGLAVMAISMMQLAFYSLLGVINNNSIFVTGFGKALGWLGTMITGVTGASAVLIGGLIALAGIIAVFIITQVMKLSDILSQLDDILVDDLPLGLKIVYTGLQALRTIVELVLVPVRTLIGAITELFNVVTGKKSITAALEDFGESVFGGLGKGIKGTFGGIKSIIGLQEGGIVTRPTLALLGEGGPEAVVPANRIGSIAPNITIHANVANDVDIDYLARVISGKLSDEMRHVI